MRYTPDSRDPFRFDSFELDLRSLTLYKSGQRVELQEKPLQVLALLLERPGEIVTRHELREKLWGSNTHVEFDDNLNHAVKKLRDALDDSHRNPRYIETIARHGYRFISPVENVTLNDEKKGRNMAVLGAALILLVTTVWWIFIREEPVLVSGEISSLAVLPLKNLSGDPGQEYFADGITEALIAELGKVGALRVISRQSVMQFKESTKPIPQIAEELGVHALVEGSILREENRVRVTVQLIGVSPERHLWAETYDRQMDDIFAIQSDIAKQIASSLRLKLSAQERTRIEKRPTGNLTAYDFYLRGREYLNRRTKADNENAIELFSRALELDPEYALAKSGLAFAYGKGFQVFSLSPDWLDKALLKAQEAVSIDPDLPDAYVTLGFGYAQKGWRRKEWDALTKALQLAPNHPDALRQTGWGHLSRGRYDQAYALLRKAVDLDPIDPANYWTLCHLYRYVGQLEKMERWAKKALEIQPDDAPSLSLLSRAYFYQGRFEEAATVNQLLRSQALDSPEPLVFAAQIAWKMADLEKALGYSEQAYEIGCGGNDVCLTIYAAMLKETGNQTDSENVLDEVERMVDGWLEEGNETQWPFLAKARISALRGEPQPACRWLREALERGWRCDVRTMSRPSLAALQDDECVKQLVAEVRADVDRMNRRIEELEKEWETAGQ